MFKSLLAAAAVAIVATLGACTPGEGPSTTVPVSKLQQELDAVKSIARKADFGLFAYRMFTPCAQTTAKLCYDPSAAAEIAAVLTTLNLAIDVGQAALDGGAGTADDKIKLAITASVTVLKVVQKYGVG